VLDWTREDLERRGVDSPRVDAELLVADGIGCERIQLYLDLDRPLEPEELTRIRERVQRRREREPIAYILGEREFYGRSFAVSPAVLIPRPDTETLVDRALAFLAGDARVEGEREVVLETAAEVPSEAVEGEARLEPIEPEPETPPESDLGSLAAEVASPGSGRRSPEVGAPRSAVDVQRRVADLCTGSGCIGLSLAAERPELRVVLTDASAEALAVARRNAERLGLVDRVELREGDLFAPLGPARFDLIAINPPYLSEAELAECAPEVARHEPTMALVAGARGDELLERIARDAPGHLQPGGILLVEVGHRQGPAFAERLRAVPELEGVITHRDLGGIERVVEARRRR